MALQVDYRFRGLVITGAYVRIERATGGKQFGWDGQACVYANQAAADAAVPVQPDPNRPPLMPHPDTAPLHVIQLHTTYDPVNQNPLQLLYNELLTYPDFINAVKV